MKHVLAVLLIVLFAVTPAFAPVFYRVSVVEPSSGVNTAVAIDRK